MKKRPPIYITDARNAGYINELQQELKRNGLKKDEFIRIQGVLLRKQGYPRKEIAQITGKSIEALEQWLRAYHHGGIVALREKVREVPPRSMLTPKQKAEIKAVVEGQKPNDVGLDEEFWCIQTLKKYIQQHYAVVYKSEESYRKLLHYCGLSYQKVEFVDRRQSEERVSEFRERFRAKIKGGDYTDVVVMDEMSLEKYPHQFFKWHRRGVTPVLKVTKERIGTTFYGGLSLKTKQEIVHCVDNQNPNSMGMIIFLNLIKKRYQGKGKILLVLDNASFHKSQEIKKWLTQNPNIVELFNFPPYSPMRNPQEHV